MNLIARAHRAGNAFGYPAVLYEWLPGAFEATSLSAFLKVAKESGDAFALKPHALVYRDSIIPLHLLEKAANS